MDQKKKRLGEHGARLFGHLRSSGSNMAVCGSGESLGTFVSCFQAGFTIIIQNHPTRSSEEPFLYDSVHNAEEHFFRLMQPI